MGEGEKRRGGVGERQGLRMHGLSEANTHTHMRAHTHTLALSHHIRTHLQCVHYSTYNTGRCNAMHMSSCLGVCGPCVSR